MQEIHIDFQLNMLGNWHSGSGEGGLLADRLLRRDCINRPYIPASTLRGVVREQCELISRSLGKTPPSDPHVDDVNTFLPKNMTNSLVDILFGTKYIESSLYFRDAKANEQFLPVTSISRTSLYRSLNTSKEKHLFQTEYASSIELFSTISGWHKDLLVPEEDSLPFGYILLILGLNSIQRLGGDKSTGKGRCSVKLNQIQYNRVRLNLEEIQNKLKDALEYWELYVEEGWL